MPEVRRIPPTPRDQVAEDLPSSAGDVHVVTNNNRWSRIVFDFKDVSGDAWCEFSFQVAWHQDEEAQAVHDFASVGIDFLTEDGSSIDFSYVPGLSRTQIDPHSYYIAGPVYYERGCEPLQSGRVQFAFFIPAPARHLTIRIRSWRNSHPFTVSDLKIHQAVQPSKDGQATHVGSPVVRSIIPVSRRTWWDLSTTPQWQRYGIVPGQPFVVRGQLINWGTESGGTLARITFRDAQGKELAPPYEGVPSSPAVGTFIDIPVHRQTRRFTLELTPPAQAATVELGFQVWKAESLISLATPLEVSIGDDLLLENILREDNPSALSFVEDVCTRLGCRPNSETLKIRASPVDQFISPESLGPLVTFHDRLRIIQHGEASTIADRHLALCDLEPWPIPEVFEWTEDPYRSSAWRLEFQSLSWILDLARSPELGGPARAAELAISWSQANPWGQPKDPLSTYPLSMAVRAEVLLHLLTLGATSKSGKDLKRQREIFAEIVRYGFALSEIVSQNIFSPSIIQLRTACALIAISRVFPHFPIAPYWISVALAQLRSGFDQLIGPDGSSIEQSLHYRLEIVSIGLLLVHSLADVPGTEEFREHISTRLKNSLKVIVGITDPAGMLPSFGDTLRSRHHASWLRRLISGYGRSLLSDAKLAEELSYPTGPRMFAPEGDGIVAFRDYDRRPHWSYLCASFTEQRHENGHFDCSSFVYTARGVQWISDPGGASLYDSGPARHYLTSSSAHNVAAPDGRGQSSGIGWIEAQTSLNDANIVRIGTNVYGPSYNHARTFICLDNLDAVAVFDRFQNSGGLISFEGLLHFEENIAVALANSKLAIGFRNKSRLRIIPHPIAGEYSGMAIHNGRNDRPGSLQGFVSHPLGGLQPANVLNYRFSGSDTICGGVILTMTDQGLRRIVDLLARPEVKKLLG
ncbi:heparinase II/III family protein [Microvirga sp. VF16]|uniref:heparinase II/III domain-containing protein n=1 Tax=Microvirga sp. VF16 TaxID=2807101 RepID=UPI00193DD17A|nr:heparinase II/III family protein [Microvirga sp. VF16]QRM30122.1 heparinase II/III family protein [Microvirga sp. VF16]